VQVTANLPRAFHDCIAQIVPFFEETIDILDRHRRVIH